MLSVVAAAVLAIGASDVALRWIHLRPTEWLVAEEEPRRQLDQQLGWVLAPARAGRSVVGGRPIEYAIGLGRKAGAKSVMLFHHDPDRTDDDLDQIVASLNGTKPKVSAAAEGSVIELP